MADRFDEAKRALEGVPARDVWAEAQRRAEGGAELVPLALASRRVGRPTRWLAAAAVAAVAIGAVALVAADGDAPVDVGGSDAGASGEAVEAYQADGGCQLGIRGGPLPNPTPEPAETVVAGRVGTQVSGFLDETQHYTVQVPGEVVTDLVGERVEAVQLRRGTAQLWFRGPSTVPAGGYPRDHAVQVRWFTGSQEACESFTVTVSGGTEDENRHAAVDLAERVVLPSELPGCCEDQPPGGNPLADTLWQLERSTTDGAPTQGNGAVFSFTAAEVSWGDGCNTSTGPYRVEDGELILAETSDVTSSAVSCATSATSEAVGTVMAQGRVAVALEHELLELRRGSTILVLRAFDGDAGDPGGPEDPAAHRTRAAR